MKHTKEFWILMAITISVPIFVAILFVSANALVVSHIYEGESFTVNDTHAIFNLTSKSYKVNVSGTHIGGESYLINKTELDKMQFDHRYSCNVTKEFPYGWLNTTLTNCTEL
jgi:hypothetical protein